MLRHIALLVVVACGGGTTADDKSGTDKGGSSDSAATAGTTDTAGPTVDTGPTTETRVTTDSGQVWVVDRFEQASPLAVDILFVIDDSCSMSPMQAELSQSFPLFMSYLLGSGIDYHLGVTSTSIVSGASYCGGSYRDGELVSVQGTRWIDPDTPNPESVFSQMATLGTRGSGCEQGLGATYRALDPQFNSANDGFLRADAELHTIVMSDEDDQTEPQVITLADFKSWYDGLKPTPEATSFHSLVCTSADGSTCSLGVGQRYISVSEDVGGIVADIRDPFDDFIDSLGLLAAGLQRSFTLSEVPQVDTLAVEVVNDVGATLLFDEQDWSYDAAVNAVTFVSYLPEPGSQVIIRYTPR